MTPEQALRSLLAKMGNVDSVETWKPVGDHARTLMGRESISDEKSALELFLRGLDARAGVVRSMGPPPPRCARP